MNKTTPGPWVWRWKSGEICAVGKPPYPFGKDARLILTAPIGYRLANAVLAGIGEGYKGLFCRWCEMSLNNHDDNCIYHIAQQIVAAVEEDPGA